LGGNGAFIHADAAFLSAIVAVEHGASWNRTSLPVLHGEFRL